LSQERKVLFLIGLSGSGKTSCGKDLAELLNCEFIDTDEFIANKLAHQSIEQIFGDQGEETFRKLEQDTLAFISKLSKQKIGQSEKRSLIVATGGGLPVAKDNMERLINMGTVVYLACELEVLAERLLAHFKMSKMERPLLNLAAGQSEADGLDKIKKKLKVLIVERGAIYQNAHHCIDTSNLDKKEVVERLKAFL